MNKKLLKKIKKHTWFYEPVSDIKNRIVYRSLFRELRKYINEVSNRGIQFIYCEPPVADKLNCLTAFQHERINNWVFDFNKIDSEMEKLKKIYGENFSKEYLQNVYDGVKVIDWGSGKTLTDYSSQYVNISGGIRITCFQPDSYIGKIHIYGACTARGTGVEDKETVASFLQSKINSEKKDWYCVVNHGIGCGSTVKDDLTAMKNTVLHPGDIIILLHQTNKTFIRFFNKNGVDVICSSNLLNEQKLKKEWFTDDVLHTNNIGNNLIAEALKNYLINNHILSLQKKDTSTNVIFSATAPVDQLKAQYIDNVELNEYLNFLDQYADENTNNGAIVMNCNPFTLGHRYLIETAARQVDTLFVFVVQEDKSFFKFEDRFALVKKGTQDISNVVVIPSGNFVLSAVTFPGYFYKDDLRDAIVDASQDIDLFGIFIAPKLNIKVRFAGEEPLDPVTNQYNQCMKERLPLYNVDFFVITRKSNNDGKVISASYVRKLLKAKKFEEIRPVVPNSTYNFLIERFSDNQ